MPRMSSGSRLTSGSACLPDGRRSRQRRGSQGEVPWNMKLKTFFKSQLFFVIVTILITVPTLLPLTQKGFYPTQDFIYVARIYEMKRALDDGHFPVRWVPDFRYGEPLYNFYAPLPYYSAAFLKYFFDLFGGVSYLVVTKITVGLGIVLSALAMFWFGRLLSNNWGGLLAAILYTYAPYHSVDVYVRGALSESWALIFFPLIFGFAWRLSESGMRKDFIFLCLSLAGLFYTHNVMTMLSGPFIVGWMVFLVWLQRKRTLMWQYPVALVLGVGVAASFLLPAFFENKLVQTSYLTSDYFNFRGHFVALPQFFSQFWGYGASLWGPKDDMSFQVGLAHWSIVFITMLFVALDFLKIRLSRLDLLLKTSFTKRIHELTKVSLPVWLALFFSGAFLFSLFMMHNQSAPIWERFSLLSFTQFPWRFLGISIFLVSVLGSVLVLLLQRPLFSKALEKKQSMVSTLLILILSALTILLEIGYFHPESYYEDSTDDHYIGNRVLSQDDKLPKDYLPIWVKKIDPVTITQPQVFDNTGTVSQFTKKTQSARFNLHLEKPSDIIVPITYFPGWSITVDGTKTDVWPNELGLLTFHGDQGNHHIIAQLHDTPIRQLGNVLTILSLLVLLGINQKDRIRKNKI
jgi:hypothetical protein